MATTDSLGTEDSDTRCVTGDSRCTKFSRASRRTDDDDDDDDEDDDDDDSVDEDTKDDGDDAEDERARRRKANANEWTTGERAGKSQGER